MWAVSALAVTMLQSASFEDDLREALDRMRPMAKAFRLCLQDDALFEALFAQAGLPKLMREPGEATYPTHIHITETLRVKGVANGALVTGRTFDWSTGKERNLMVLLRESNGQVVGDLLATALQHGPLQEGVRPADAALNGSWLYVTGHVNSETNYPSPAVMSFVKVAKAWSMTTSEGEAEAHDLPPLRLSRSGRLAPWRVMSSTYPKNLSVSHSNAMVAVTETWTFAPGRPATVRSVKLATPLEALDRRAPDLLKGDLRHVRPHCVSAKVARAFVEHLVAHRKEGDPDIRFPQGDKEFTTREIYLTTAQSWLHFSWVRRRWLIDRVRFEDYDVVTGVTPSNPSALGQSAG